MFLYSAKNRQSIFCLYELHFCANKSGHATDSPMYIIYKSSQNQLSIMFNTLFAANPFNLLWFPSTLLNQTKLWCAPPDSTRSQIYDAWNERSHSNKQAGSAFVPVSSCQKATWLCVTLKVVCKHIEIHVQMCNETKCWKTLGNLVQGLTFKHIQGWQV